MTWLVAAASLLATWLNVRGQVASFWIWTATNATRAAVDFAHDLAAQACLHLVYVGLAVWGIRRWSRCPPAAATGG